MQYSFLNAIGFTALLVSTSPLMAAIQIESGTTPTSLLELYTSEGCSSCPPAEAWLSRLKEDPRLWKDFVPVAFHVDYWDHLGWKDPFASKSYTDRQYDYADFWRNRSIYTPGFVLDGREWRGWFNREVFPRTSPKLVGVLTARSDDSLRWTLRFRPAANSTSASFDFHAALLGFHLGSDVKAGENRGRKLEHDFVVLALGKAGSSKDGDFFQGELSLTTKLPLLPKRLGFAAWVTPSKSFEPLQVIGGWLPSAKQTP